MASLGLFIFLGLVFIVALTALWGGLSAAPWLPTRSCDVERVLRLAELKAGDTLFDLGSGDGRLLIAAAKRYGVKAVGFEVSLLPYLWSLICIRFTGVQNLVQIRYRDFFRADLSQAQAIICFLTPKAMIKLEPKLERELSSSSRFISYCFALPSWLPKKVDRPASKDVPVYLYCKN